MMSKVEAVFLQRLQFETQHGVVAPSVLGDAVVRNDERSALGGHQFLGGPAFDMGREPGFRH